MTFGVEIFLFFNEFGPRLWIMTTSTPRTICDLMENAQETDATLDLDKTKIRRW